MRNKKLESSVSCSGVSFIYLFLIIHFLFLILLSSCSIQKKISRSASGVLHDPSLETAHVGISIYEPAAHKYWYESNADKYFVPASNTKIPTCYAAMKYLGDSLVGLRYGFSKDMALLAIQPTGDPTLLHDDFKKQPAWEFLARNKEKYKETIALLDTAWREERWGSGWTWSDYDQYYMAERNSLPIFGNVLKIRVDPIRENLIDSADGERIKVFNTRPAVFDYLVNRAVYLQALVANDYAKQVSRSSDIHVRLQRKMDTNEFVAIPDSHRFAEAEIPFVTNGTNIAQWIILDSLKYKFGTLMPRGHDSLYSYLCQDCRAIPVVIKNWSKIYSQPTDSLLKPMMHRSDNFFAEQSLLMVSNEKLGIMNDEKIIDTLLKSDFKDLPQKPRWVDGSGLSRYNLFSPKDFVFILDKMKNEFGMERLKVILPTGGEGTFSNYFIPAKDQFYAKTGSLSGVIALSGFLYTKKNKLLVFSILVNNHRASASDVRKAIEKFLLSIRDGY